MFVILRPSNIRFEHQFELRGGVPRTHKLRSPLVGALGYQRFPLSKPGEHQNIALHAVPADRNSTYLISSFRIIQLHFPLNLLRCSTVELVINRESELYLWLQCILFRSDMTIRG